MTFWEHFIRLLPRRPRAALAALYWHVTKRKVRARNRLRVASADLNFAYDMWIRKHDRIALRRSNVESAIAVWDRKPRFVVLLTPSQSCTPEERSRSLRSLDGQTYPFHELVEVTPGLFNAAIGKSNGDFVVPLRMGDSLSENALFHFAEALQANPRAQIIFGDHDELDERGRRRRPWFKPEWNEEMFLAQDYLSPAVAIATPLARKVSGDEGGDAASLLIAATARSNEAIVHVPHIVCHVSRRSPIDLNNRRLDAMARYLLPRGATCSPGPFGTIKVQWPLPASLPLVSIIVPTKDKVHLLRACLESVLERTTYENYEILIVDNGSTEKNAITYLNQMADRPNIRVIRYSAEYNFSAINNFAVREAKGSYLCLLNNDTEVIEPNWLSEMMRYAVRSDVGAVGAKLLYEDRTIQHAGIVIGVGEAAGHAHRLLPVDQRGYFGMAHVTQFISAVTAACLVVDKRKFLAVGGLDEVGLRVAFNDVDFCLKLDQAGLRNIYVPHAVLLHHESKSRGLDSSPRNVDRFKRELSILQERWDTKNYLDPLFSPHLDRSSERFVLNV